MDPGGLMGVFKDDKSPKSSVFRQDRMSSQEADGTHDPWSSHTNTVFFPPGQDDHNLGATSKLDTVPCWTKVRDG